MPLASLESPYRAFPSRGAVPALAGLVLPCGFALDRPTARPVPSVSRPLSPARRPLAAAGPCGFAGLEGRDDGSPESLGVARHAPGGALVCGVTSRIGRARRTRRPARPLRSFAPLESPFSRRPLLWPELGSTGRCSPGLTSPLAHAPAAHGLGVRADVRGRDGPVPRASSKARDLATRFRQVRTSAVGSRTHGPSACSVDRTGHATVGQRPCSRALSRSARTPVASPVPPDAWKGLRPFAPV